GGAVNPHSAITMRRSRRSLMPLRRTLFRTCCIVAPLCAAAGAMLAAGSYKLPFGELRHASQQPVLSPPGSTWESAGVFNPAVVKPGNEYLMLYRAQDHNGTSRLGYATSRDGIHFTRRPQPVFQPEKDYEQNGGVEDPRLVSIGGVWYLTYTAYNKKDAQLALATSKDLIHWQRKGVILPAYKGNWNV